MADPENADEITSKTKFLLSGTLSHIKSVTVGSEGVPEITIYLSDAPHTMDQKLKTLSLKPEDLVQHIAEIPGYMGSELSQRLETLTKHHLSPQAPLNAYEINSARRIVSLTTSNLPRPQLFAWKRRRELQRNQRAIADGQTTPQPKDESFFFILARTILLTSTKEQIKTIYLLQRPNGFSMLEVWILGISSINELDTLTSLVTREHNNPLKKTDPTTPGSFAAYLHSKGLWAEFTTATEKKLIKLLRKQVLTLAKSTKFQAKPAPSPITSATC